MTHPAWLLALALLASNGQAQWARKPGMPSGSSTSYLVENFSTPDWDASNFAPPEDVRRFQDLRFGLLVSFGITTRDKAELSWGTIDKAHRKMPDGDARSDGVHTPTESWVSWAKDLELPDFNADQWVRQAQESGFKYVVFTAKHHEGFHFWDTQLSDFKVTKSPFGRDMLGELIAACHRAGMPVGIYYSQRDWYRPTYQPTGFGPDGRQPGPAHRQYVDYQFAAVRELLSRYGKIDVFWWDALWWGGMFNKDMWDSERLTREVRKLQPHIVMNNRASVPGDFDTPEQRLGGFQTWRPFEAVVSLEDTWSYSGGRPKSASEVISLLVNSAENNGNLLLSIGPRWTGDFAPDDMATLQEVGRWLEHNGASIYGTRGGPWRGYPWGGSTHRGATAYLHVNSRAGDRIGLAMPVGKRVQSVRLLSGAGMTAAAADDLLHTIDQGQLTIELPATRRDKADTIIQIQFDQDLTDVVPIAFAEGDAAAASEGAALSPFDYELVYGPRLKSGVSVTASSRAPQDSTADLANVVTRAADAIQPFSTDRQIGARIDIDLIRVRPVTGIVLSAHAGGAPLQLDGSLDGKSWTKLWVSPAGDPSSRWDIGINSFNAGAQTPGRPLRLLRLTVQGAAPEVLQIGRFHIWAKDDP